MRPSALIPIVFGLAALVLSFLCLFAGSSKGFMEDYAIVTLNTSRIGENLFNKSSTSSSSSNPITSWLHNVTSTIETDIEDDLQSDLNSFARALGVHDFYSAHMLDYCEGYFTPATIPNATYPHIHKNVTSCSNKTALYHFDPTESIQQELNKSGHSNINLTDLNWPTAVDDGLAALKVAQRAAFILYCIAIALIAFAVIFAIVSLFLDGRLSAFVNILLSALAFLAIGIASAIVTVIAVKADNVINKYGNLVGISASKGGKFLALTWVATALLFLSMFVWMVECCIGRRSRRRNNYSMHEKMHSNY